MSNPSKQKGTAWERVAADYLAEAIPGYDRVGSVDFGAGDLTGPYPIPHECKAEKKITLSEYAKQIKGIKARTGAPLGAVIIKAPRKPVSEAYVMLTLAEWRAILPTIAADLPAITARLGTE
ncbi:hypothetical protein GCM10010466_29680 [Planomonospora alba]|uniref:Uncharacterized protein n=1 Tax=Planomonospora alba TaxID=161354 RepID=A0ABP6N713_9ACTN